MMDLWTARTRRKQIMIGAAGILLGLVIFQLVVLGPLLRARGDAEQSLQRSAQTLDVVSAAQYSTAAERISQAPALPTDTMRALLIDGASDRGLSVSRLQSDDNATLTVQFESVVPQSVFVWLQDIERDFAIAPKRATLRADADGKVDASFEFQAAMQ